MLEVESDLATAVSWIHSYGHVRWDYVYSLRRVCALISSFLISVRHVFREATSATDFLPNWACTHRVNRYFLCSRDLPADLFGILYLDAETGPHVRS